MKSVLFRDRNLLHSLKALAIVSLPGDTNGIFATGVPPHIPLLTDMRKMQTEIFQILPELKTGFNTSTENTVARIIKELEKRAIGARTVTRDGVEGMLRATLEQILTDKGIGVPNPPADPVDENPAEIDTDVVHTHNGRFIKLQVDFNTLLVPLKWPGKTG